MDKQRIVIDLNKELWRQVSIKVAELQTTKRKFLEMALENELRRAKGETSTSK